MMSRYDLRKRKPAKAEAPKKVVKRAKRQVSLAEAYASLSTSSLLYAAHQLLTWHSQ